MTNRFDFARLSIRIAQLSGLLALLAVITHRLEVVDFQIALPGLAFSALTGLLAVLLGVLGLFTAMRQRKSAMLALIGALLGFVVAAPTAFSILAGTDAPRIHDITTDLEDPPAFKAVLGLRAATDNPLDRQLPENLAQLQQEGYPDLKPLLLAQPRDIVFEQALQVVKARGWEIASVSAGEEGIIEATATTPIMGFKDDVVIRIQSAGEMTQVDMRSVSRVGVSDLGKNAARIKEFLDDLTDRLKTEN